MLAMLALAATPLLLKEYRQPLVPPELLPLGGYTERRDALMQAGGDELFAQIAILQSGNRKVALVAFEGLTCPESLYREVTRRLPGIDVMMVATHTHSAPDTQMLNDRMTFKIPGIAAYKNRWLNWYALQIAGGISIADQSPGREVRRLGYSLSITDLARARRPNTQVSNRLVKLFADSEPIVTVFGAHGTIYGPERMTTSGDWLGSYMRQSSGLMWPGAIGNASPNADGPDSESRIAKMLRGLQSSGHIQPLSAQIEFHRRKIDIGAPIPHPDFARTNGVTPELAQLAVQKFAPDAASLSILQVGKLIIIGVPGEPSGDLEKQIVDFGEKKGFEISVVSHCNGWMGYLLTPEDYRRGGYEATLMFYGPDSGTRVVTAAKQEIEQLEARSASGQG